VGKKLKNIAPNYLLITVFVIQKKANILKDRLLNFIEMQILLIIILISLSTINLMSYYILLIQNKKLRRLIKDKDLIIKNIIEVANYEKEFNEIEHCESCGACDNDENDNIDIFLN